MFADILKRIIAVLLLLAASVMPQATANETVVTLVAAGDNLIHSSIFRDAKTAEGYDFSPMYKYVSDIISSADIAYINQETPLGKSNFSGYPHFCTPCEMADNLVSVGFDVIGIANNHMLDRGDEGLRFTRNYLAERAEAVIGYDRDSVSVIERKGIKVAFAQMTYSTNCDGESDIPRLSFSLAEKLIKKAKRLADVTVMCVHFGDEFDSGRAMSVFPVNEKQEEYARFMANCGADIIIGTHPHVVQKTEWIPRDDGGKTLCVYSLGNFLSNMRYGAQMLGGMLTAEIVKSNGEVFVRSPEIIPTVCHFDGMHKGYRIYPLCDYSDKLCALHGTGDEKNERRFCMETLKDYYESNVAPEFRYDKYIKKEEKHDKS